MILAILATIYTTFTVPTHNQGAAAMPEFIQTRTCDPFALNCNLEASWTGTDTSPIGTVRPCNLTRPRITAGDICCLLPATPKREEMLFCGPTAYNKDLLYARNACRTGSDGIVYCALAPPHEPFSVCTARLGGGCPCNILPSQGTCVYP